MIDYDPLEGYRDPQAYDDYNGFQIRACYGDWRQGPLTATSRQMISVCQRRT